MTRNYLLTFALTAGITLPTINAQAQNTDKNILNHMDFGVTLGTTGIGFEVAMPVTDYARVRTGMSYMPKVEVPMTFDIQVGNDPTTSAEKFNNLSKSLSSFTGNEVKDEVEMIGRPTLWNWSFLVDVFPLKNNRHWHLTAGFFLGGSKVAEAYNKTESMASLLAVDIYNNLYDKVHGLSRRELLRVKIIDLPGTEGLANDPDMLIELQKRLDVNGRMGVHLGKYKHDITDEDGNVIHKQGDSYIMDPDDNSMVSADIKVNAFKPYLGLGYDGRLTKHDSRLRIGFDAGIMFWGGTPALKTHDGTDLINDVEKISGKVGRYVSRIEKFKVFPLLSLRVSYSLF